MISTPRKTSQGLSEIELNNSRKDNIGFVISFDLFLIVILDNVSSYSLCQRLSDKEMTRIAQELLSHEHLNLLAAASQATLQNQKQQSRRCVL